MSDPLYTGLLVAISTPPYVNLKPRNLKTVSEINQNTSCTGFGWDS